MRSQHQIAPQPDGTDEHEFARAAPRTPEAGGPTSEGQARCQIVLLEVDGNSYGLPIAEVREILPFPRLTTIVGGGVRLVGVTTVRGAIVPVLNLAHRLGLPAVVPGGLARMVLVEGPTGPVGLLVDRVREVLRVERQCLTAPDPVLAEQTVSVVASILRQDDRLVSLLDVAAVVGEGRSATAVEDATNH